MRGFLALAVGLSLALRMGLATQTSNPGNPAPPAMEIIRNTSGAPGVFSAQPDGSVIHIQSGFVCPASFPNANLWNLQIYRSDAGRGTDVGCDYARVGSISGKIEAKFTIFLVKAKDGAMLAQAFDHYRSEMHDANPPVKVGGDVFRISGTAAAKYPPFKSEGDDVLLNGRKCRDELVVGIVNGWVIELRSTYPTEFAPGDSAAAGDLAASAFIWTTTVGAFADSRKR